MGNSEIGHLNIGAGKIVWQILTQINRDIRTGAFEQNTVLRDFLERAKRSGKTAHFMGLLSDGGVHSHINHLKALLLAAKKAGLPDVATHAFLDGRDVPPRSAEKYIDEVEALTSQLGLGRLATIQGRYYVMDRDNRWERTEKGYRLLTEGAGHRAKSAREALKMARARNEGDEFVEPTALEWALENRRGLIKDGDSVLFFNFRPDRARQISHAFLDKQFTKFQRMPEWPGQFVTMARYDTFDREVSILYAPVEVRECLGSAVAASGAKQLRVAETEKYAHVTYFFNGGYEPPYKGEERLLVPSQKVATYDLMPEMSAPGVTDVLCKAIAKKQHDFILCNYANGDMVGHSGVLAAAVKAVETVDQCLARVLTTADTAGATVLVTADHGNCELMIDPATGGPHTAHTTNPVPLVIVGEGAPKRHLRTGGSLRDVGPTILQLLGIEPTKEMTGKDLRDT